MKNSTRSCLTCGSIFVTDEEENGTLCANCLQALTPPKGESIYQAIPRMKGKTEPEDSDK